MEGMTEFKTIDEYIDYLKNLTTTEVLEHKEIH
jgi:hypothetical protein